MTVRVLLDTHAFLWWLTDSKRLSEAAKRVIADETNDISVSAVSAWEIATKHRLGRLPEGEAVIDDIVGSIAGQGFKELTIDVADAQRAGQLSGPHRDPFDRMLIAQALARDLVVVSIDAVFDRYGVKRHW